MMSVPESKQLKGSNFMSGNIGIIANMFYCIRPKVVPVPGQLCCHVHEES